MCISTAAIALFLTLIGPDKVTLGDNRVIVHATAADAHWVAHGDEWCTMAPYFERVASAESRLSRQ